MNTWARMLRGDLGFLSGPLVFGYARELSVFGYAQWRKGWAAPIRDIANSISDAPLVAQPVPGKCRHMYKHLNTRRDIPLALLDSLTLEFNSMAERHSL